MKLKDKHCEPCEGGVEALTGDALEAVRQLLGFTWDVIEEHHIVKEFEFKDFKNALAFVNQIGEIAESEGHHPDLTFGWGYVKVKIYTHAIDGLSENDFILAAKIDQI